jgi:hypothetical protein
VCCGSLLLFATGSYRPAGWLLAGDLSQNHGRPSFPYRTQRLKPMHKAGFPVGPVSSCYRAAGMALIIIIGGTMTAEVQRLTSGSRRIWNWYMQWRRYVKFYTNAILAPYGTPRKDSLWFHFDASLLPNSTSSVQSVGVNINSRHKKGERS